MVSKSVGKENQNSLYEICNDIGKVIEKHGQTEYVAACLTVYGGMGYGAVDLSIEDLIESVREAYEVGKKNKGF